jgi:hypothetical protein
MTTGFNGYAGRVLTETGRAQLAHTMPKCNPDLYVQRRARHDTRTVNKLYNKTPEAFFCTICQETADVGESLIVTYCDHVFHFDCTKARARSLNAFDGMYFPSCPVCRAPNSQVDLFVLQMQYAGPRRSFERQYCVDAMSLCYALLQGP